MLKPLWPISHFSTIGIQILYREVLKKLIHARPERKAGKSCNYYGSGIFKRFQ